MNPVPIGIIGIAVTGALVLGALNYDKLPGVAGGTTYQAMFSEAAGLSPGDQVMVAGVNVGTVSDVRLDGPQVRVTFTVGGDTTLGNAPASTSKPAPSWGVRRSGCARRAPARSPPAHPSPSPAPPRRTR